MKYTFKNLTAVVLGRFQEFTKKDQTGTRQKRNMQVTDRVHSRYPWELKILYDPKSKHSLATGMRLLQNENDTFV